MNIDKKELKLISLEFRTIANRLLNCNHNTGADILKKFISFIDENELISEFVQGYVNPADFKPVDRGACFISMGDTKQEEISFTYQYLKYCTKTFNNFYHDIAYRYANDANDAVKEFCNRIILPFVNYIEGYLTEIGIKMGYDEDVKFAIHVNGGNAQVNIANDNSTIKAIQNNGVDFDELERLISNLLAHVDLIENKEDREIVDEGIEVIREELRRDKPRKSFLKAAINAIKAVAGTAELLAAAAAIYTFIDNLSF